MDRSAASAGVLRLGRSGSVALFFILVVAACGGTANGGQAGGGGGGAGDYDKVIAAAQLAFGTPMQAGTVDGNTITITVDGFSASGAKLFMCGQIKEAVAQDAPGADVVIKDPSGATLVTLAECKK